MQIPWCRLLLAVSLHGGGNATGPEWWQRIGVGRHCPSNAGSAASRRRRAAATCSGSVTRQVVAARLPGLARCPTRKTQSVNVFVDYDAFSLHFTAYLVS